MSFCNWICAPESRLLRFEAFVGADYTDRTHQSSVLIKSSSAYRVYHKVHVLHTVQPSSYKVHQEHHEVKRYSRSSSVKCFPGNMFFKLFWSTKKWATLRATGSTAAHGSLMWQKKDTQFLLILHNERFQAMPPAQNWSNPAGTGPWDTSPSSRTVQVHSSVVCRVLIRRGC